MALQEDSSMPFEADDDDQADQATLSSDLTTPGLLVERPDALRSGLSLLSWSLFRGAALATFLRTIDPRLRINFVIWKLESVDPVDPHLNMLRRARWRLLFVLPFLTLMLCYGAI
jgi:hypothetical protein